MISDLLQCIQQDETRSELLKERFDTIICYPGAGADIYPCAVIEKVDNTKLRIPNFRDKSILYLFCDPLFTVDRSVHNSFLYSNYITNLCGKKNLQLEQLLKICEDSRLYVNAYGAFKNIEEMQSFTRIDYSFEQKREGYHYKILIDSKPCHILMVTCEAKTLWRLLEKYNVSVEGAFLWNVQSWSPAESMANIDKKHLPKWFIGNRPGKNGGCGQLYKRKVYKNDISELICKIRGLDEYSEDVCIESLDTQF